MKMHGYKYFDLVLTYIEDVLDVLPSCKNIGLSCIWTNLSNFLSLEKTFFL